MREKGQATFLHCGTLPGLIARSIETRVIGSFSIYMRFVTFAAPV